MKSLCLAVCLAALCLAGVEALSCGPDGPISCAETPQADIASMNCPQGAVDGPCSCICARVLGETCGGPWGIEGTCADGLECNADSSEMFSEGICVETP